MFANTKAFSGFALDDLEAAKKFYGETLGLSTSEHYGLLTLHLAAVPLGVTAALFAALGASLGWSLLLLAERHVSFEVSRLYR